MTSRVLATCNERELIEVEPGHLALVERGVLPGVLVFVPGLLGAIAAVNGVVQLAMGHLVAALVLLAVAGLALGGTVALVRARRRQREVPAASLPRLLVIDVTGGRLLSPDGQALAPLASASMRTAMQVTSSSSALQLEWPGGNLVVGRGTPFGDSVDEMAAALRQAGVRGANG